MKAYLLAGAALAAMAPAHAFAQEPAPATAERDTPAASLQADIIVTAQRRAEALQDVPIAISVFSSTDRDRRGIRTIQDFSNFTPGLAFSASLDRLSLRGIGRLTNTIGSDPGVAIYNDGLYTASNAEASKSPMFVDRVEFLRGPQGTLFGRNSVGGAINVISKRPKDFFEGEFRTTVDNLALIAEGYLSGPIAGGLKGRISVQMGPRKNSAIYRNIGTTGTSRDEGFQNRFLVEGQLQYDFSPDVQLWLKYSHAEWRDSNPLGVQVEPYETSLIAGATGVALVSNAAFQYAVPNPSVADYRTMASNTLNQVTLSENHNFVANFTADLGGVTLKYVGGYSQYKYRGLSDLDYTARDFVTTNFGSATIPALVPFGAGDAFRTYSYNPTYVQDYNEDKKYFSNEVTLSSSGGDRFNWIVGAYQFHESYFQPVYQYVGGANTDALSQRIAAPICLTTTFAVAAICPTNPRRSFYEGTGDLKTDSYAGFGQADFEIVNGLKLTAGLRYSSDKKSAIETYRIIQWQPAGANVYCTLTPGAAATVIGFGACGGAAAAQDLTQYVLGTSTPGTATRRLNGTWDGFSWRLGLDYKLNRDTLLFGSYSRGLKAGGFNLGSFADFPVVDKERVDSFEIGLKSRPLPGFTFNATAFYYDYRNPQVPVLVGRPGTTLTTTNFFNLPKTKSQGIEFETRWDVTRRLEISTNYSYLDTEILREAINQRTGAPLLLDDEGSPGNNPESIVGNRLPAASKHKVAVSALYDLPVGGNDHVFLAGSYVYRSDAYYTIFQSPISRAPGWDQVDARITYTRPDDGLTFIAFVRNAFDSIGYDGASSTAANGGYRQVYSFTPPRQYGLEMQIKF
jgi:iron complex outermembrane receptor protein